MVKFDNVKIHNLDNAINGIVEFETSDSKIGMYLTDYADEVIDEMKFKYGEATPDAWVEKNDNIANVVALGPTDMKKLQLEASRGNREFLKYITVTCDVTAPLSWWIEFDRHYIGMSVQWNWPKPEFETAKVQAGLKRHFNSITMGNEMKPDGFLGGSWSTPTSFEKFTASNGNEIDVPKKEGTKTTYNVGTISGGTSVNTIAQDAKFNF